MKITEYRNENQLLIQIDGRLDATWADDFKETLLKRIRNGEHHIILDAAQLSFLSSLGIRSLMVIYKELTSVQGSFQIVHASGMVKETLEHSGLGQWLSDLDVTAETFQPDQNELAEPEVWETFELDSDAVLTLETVDAWQQGAPVDSNKSRSISFEKDRFIIGIGGAGNDYESAKDYFGEFVAVGGHVAVQPPDERGRPDCILSEQSFVPSLQCIQALSCQGSMARLIRFRRSEKTPFYPLSTLVDQMRGDRNEVGFVVIGETEGLVGAHLIQSPGRLTDATGWTYPEIKEWLSFSGERVFSRQQTVIAGVARREGDRTVTHAHAAVFPYQPLPNGRIDLADTVHKLFNGPPPSAVLHLIDDQRPGNGVGESALFSGACWCAPIQNGGGVS
jgi:anti-anti-sigma factor